MRTIKTIAALLLAIISIAPDAHARKRLVLDAASKPILFRLDVAGAITPPGETFSRASSATYRDAAGVLQTASSGVKRNAHYALDPVSGLYKPTLLLEGQRTNLLLHSRDLTNAAWTKRGTAAVAQTATGVDGVANSASAITSLGGDDNDVYSTAVAVTSATRCEPAFWLRKVTASGTLAAVNSQSSVFGLWSVDLALVGSSYEHITRAHPAVTITNEFSGTAGNAAGLLFKCTAGAPIAVDVDFTQLEVGAFSSSSIPTVASTVSRAADSLSFPYLHPPREMTMFVRVATAHTNAGLSERLVKLGSSSLFTNSFLLYVDTSNKFFFDNNGVNSVVSVGTFIAGDTVEAVLQLSSAGLPVGRISQNGAAENVGTGTAIGMPPRWGNTDTILLIGAGGAGESPAFAGFRDVIIARGIRDLNFFRGMIAP